MGEKASTVRLNYEIGGNALRELREMERIQRGLGGTVGGGARGGAAATGASGAAGPAGDKGLRDQFRQMSEAAGVYRMQERWARQEQALRERMLREEERSRRDRDRREREESDMRRRSFFMATGGLAAGFGMASLLAGRGAGMAQGFAAPALTENQRRLQGWQEAPLIGRLVTAGDQIANALQGITSRIHGARLNLERMTVALTGRQMVLSAGLELAGQLTLARREQQFAAGASPVGVPIFDRTTVGGQVAAGEFFQRLPHLQQVASAGRRSQAGFAAHFDARRMADAARLESSIAQHNMREAERRALDMRSRNPNRADLVDAESSRAQAALRAQQAAERARQAEQQAQQAAQEALRREMELRRANLALMQADLNILRQREERLSRGAVSIGMMNPFQAQLGLQAVESMAAGQNVPWWMLQQAQAVAPQFTERFAERRGEQSPVFQRLRELGAFGDDRRPLEDLRRSMDELAQAMSAEELSIEQAETNSQLDILNQSIPALIAALEDMTAAMLKRTMALQDLAIANQGQQ